MSLLSKLAAVCQQQGGAAAAAGQLQQAFDMLSTASKLRLAPAACAAAGGDCSQLQAAVQAACCIAFKLLEQQPSRTALLDDCSRLASSARQQLLAAAQDQEGWHSTAPALRLLQLQFAVATYGRDLQQQKALLQAMVQHPLVTLRHLCSCGKLSGAAGQPWCAANVACIAYGLALRLATQQQELLGQQAQEAAAAVSSLLQCTRSSTVRLKVCERAVQLMAQLGQQGQQYPAAELQWLWITCWN